MGLIFLSHQLYTDVTPLIFDGVIRNLHPCEVRVEPYHTKYLTGLGSRVVFYLHLFLAKYFYRVTLPLLAQSWPCLYCEKDVVELCGQKTENGDHLSFNPSSLSLSVSDSFFEAMDH